MGDDKGEISSDLPNVQIEDIGGMTLVGNLAVQAWHNEDEYTTDGVATITDEVIFLPSNPND
ncbi:hypothetical protein KDA00_03130 [Candidatus Saccharibacteria bacterium]|nr:hypothetical protein [Candidatus Saccharibacteria bacterium]